MQSLERVASVPVQALATGFPVPVLVLASARLYALALLDVFPTLGSKGLRKTRTEQRAAEEGGQEEEVAAEVEGEAGEAGVVVEEEEGEGEVVLVAVGQSVPENEPPVGE